MTDQELLTQASKAAGLNYTMFSASGELDPKHWGMVAFFGHGHVKFWNPLASDGDALRLAVARNIHLGIETGAVSAWHCDRYGSFCSEPIGNDKAAATRRAIVRAVVASNPANGQEGKS